MAVGDVGCWEQNTKVIYVTLKSERFTYPFRTTSILTQKEQAQSTSLSYPTMFFLPEEEEFSPTAEIPRSPWYLFDGLRTSICRSIFRDTKCFLAPAFPRVGPQMPIQGDDHPFPLDLPSKRWIVASSSQPRSVYLPFGRGSLSGSTSGKLLSAAERDARIQPQPSSSLDSHPVIETRFSQSTTRCRQQYLHLHWEQGQGLQGQTHFIRPLP